ncbi:ABC transporter ATP-binding protein [Streptomonospora salina]|uniref:Multiple sugar transport system ATP-binding protein n=1 Tax=Streptomonospora salina TaxID=104205 RepID=A0A841EAA8_9ACTN|nr:sn-glycerol-3-phosphate ABC transporter ATP-binding protein UgpC [Streptomonospora salina]MBB5996391.1 multiple sugar transport system ATP-binding protein [Streptomonospora salina]
MAKIVLDGVDKVYSGGVKAVDNLNLEINDSEFMVLVGPSGCGKSTALRMIAGLEEITGGDLYIGDDVVNDRPPKDRDIAMVFQNYALYPHMTVEQNLAFGLKLRKIPKQEIQKRVQEAASMLGLETYLKRRPAALSGGQRQRVAMGRAIVREPQAFLMDEPLSNLDAKLRVQMRASLNQLHERLGVTTVYVTHDQTEAMTLGDRVAVLRDGRLQQADTPKNLFDHPANLFVAGFIGSPAMNFINAELQKDGAGAVLKFAEHSLAVPESVVEARPGLRDYMGTEIILGIRPSDYEDATITGNGSGVTMEAVADVTEELGTEINVIFSVNAPPVRHEEAAALAADATGDGEDADSGLSLSSEDKAQFTARVSPRSSVRPGGTISLAVDISQLHYFDKDSGLAIGHAG